MKTPIRQLSIVALPLLAFVAFVCLGAIQPQDIARLPSVTNAFGDDLVVVLNGRSEAAKMTVKQISDYAAALGDTVTIFGALSATPAAGSVLADSCELVAIRLY